MVSLFGVSICIIHSPPPPTKQTMELYNLLYKIILNSSHERSEREVEWLCRGLSFVNMHYPTYKDHLRNHMDKVLN